MAKGFKSEHTAQGTNAIDLQPTIYDEICGGSDLKEFLTSNPPKITIQSANAEKFRAALIAWAQQLPPDSNEAQMPCEIVTGGPHLDDFGLGNTKFTLIIRDDIESSIHAHTCFNFADIRPDAVEDIIAAPTTSSDKISELVKTVYVSLADGYDAE